MAIFKRETRKPRHKVEQHVWMTLDGGFAKRNCTLLDLSLTGAKIRVNDKEPVDGKLSIAFTGDVRKTTRCRLVWRKGNEIGVEFLHAA
ncbi:MAG: PilZ domain-containing protein [Rhizobiales bacterium]|nr:PilZ domain-containing protein [Hyphomicrobiales bacterium]